MLLVWTHGQCLAPSVRIDKRHRNEVRIRHRQRVSYRERVFVNWLDRSPDVDDLIPGLEQLFGFLWEVMRDSTFGGGVRLVDMHAGDRPTKGEGWRIGVCLWATDSMVEDEDS